MIVLQPDIGTLAIITVMALVVYFIAGAPIVYVAGLISAGIAGLAIMIKAAPYRAARFTTFLNPEFEPQGIGYHINQALLAIGSGGLFGRGFGLSRQKYNYLPEVVGDSIFAVIGEELGFLIAVLFIALLVFFAHTKPSTRLSSMVSEGLEWRRTGSYCASLQE